MANVFGILTAIVLALASFVAYKNKEAYTNEIAHRKEWERKLDVTKVRLKLAQDTLASTRATRIDTEGVVAKLKTEEAERKKANDLLKQEVDTKTQTVADNKAKLDDIREKTKAIGEIKDLAQKVKTIRNEMEDLRQSIAANLTKLANLTEQNAQTVGRNDVLKSHTEMIARRESFFTKARISSIYANYGFVTLSSGHLVGVVTGSTLEIVRNGQTVGKLLVTAVESNTASASIVPDSLAEGTVLMIGDQVVPSHKAGPKPKEPAKPATAPAETPAKEAAPAADPTLEAAPGKTTEPETTPAETPATTPEAAPAAPEAAPTAPEAAPTAPEAAPAAPEAAPAAGTESN